MPLPDVLRLVVTQAIRANPSLEVHLSQLRGCPSWDSCDQSYQESMILSARLECELEERPESTPNRLFLLMPLFRLVHGRWLVNHPVEQGSLQDLHNCHDRVGKDLLVFGDELFSDGEEDSD